MCRFLGSPAISSIQHTELDVESTDFLAFLEGLADVELEIFVVSIFDQRDDIYSLEYIGDNAYSNLASCIATIVSNYRRCSGLAHWISHC